MFGCERCSFFVAVWLVRVLEKKNSRPANFASASASRCILFSVAFALESARELWLANASLRSIFCMRVCVFASSTGLLSFATENNWFQFTRMSVGGMHRQCVHFAACLQSCFCMREKYWRAVSKSVCLQRCWRGFYSLSIAYVPWVLCSLSESCCVMVRSLDSICCFLFHERQTK